MSCCIRFLCFKIWPSSKDSLIHIFVLKTAMWIRITQNNTGSSWLISDSTRLNLFWTGLNRLCSQFWSFCPSLDSCQCRCCHHWSVFMCRPILCSCVPMYQGGTTPHHLTQHPSFIVCEKIPGSISVQVPSQSSSGLIPIES